MAKTFPTERLMLKVMEEMAELNEVCIKTITKTPELKPPVEKIIEEIGDLWFRTRILVKNMGIEEEVRKRYEEKGAQIDRWYKKTHE